MELNGKVGIVTGAARGIGKCTVETLLTKGVKIGFCDINAQEGEATLGEMAKNYGESNVIFKVCDVRKENEIRDFIEAVKSKFHRLDIFMNNASIFDESNWEILIDVNLGGYIRGTKLAIEYLRKDNGGNGGVIINVASTSGYTPIAAMPVYTAAKHGIIGFSRSKAIQPEVKDNGIRIVCLCPGRVETPTVSTRAHVSIVTGLLKKVHDKVFDIGKIRMETVTDGVIKILEDDSNNGKQLYVESKFGMGYRSDTDPISAMYLDAQNID